ncbi:SDR family oxidoreductase [Bryobacter aggregatus]|uniref:SDR family oxidoreductase n=1 Tax=Bryobacter aggregatus TaxID=360054 RepID=UPI0009B5CA9A|nr:SDR family oxidoreductase [Bryobacter aggregatus]
MKVLQGWSLENCRAVVSGGSRGIGAAIVEQLSALGARVVSASLELPSARPGVIDVAADVSTVAGRDAVLAAIPQDWDGIEILVNNVGMNYRKPTVEYTLEEFEKIQSTNATSMFELSRLLHPRLKASGRASIVNIGSIAGSMSVGSSAAYAMSKAAVAHLGRYLAVEWASDGIRVNTVAPAWVATALTQTIQDSEAAMAVVSERTPLGRMARPEEIASVATFLCLPCASYLTGAVIPVDGGLSVHAMDITSALRQRQ